MNYGYQNEYDFVELFNNKYIDELDNNSQQFLKELFEDKINKEEKIKSWKNKINQKTDIFIKHNGYVKSVSLKCGNSNSMHHEQIEDFKLFLEKLGISYKIINYYVSYHYGYGRNSDGNIDFSKLFSAEEYKKIYQDEIDIFNNAINRSKIIIEMVDRFIVRGRNSDYDIDVLVVGTVNDYVWIFKYDLYDLILSKKSFDFTSPHIACLTIGPKKRNLNRDSKNAKERYLICVRWNFIREEILNFKTSCR